MQELIALLDSSYLLPFFLLFARVVSFFALMPVFNASYLPVQVRIAIAFYLSIFLHANIADPTVVTEENFLTLLINEITLGIVASMILHMVFAAIRIIGELISYATVLSMSTQFDPSTGTQETNVAKLLNILAMFIFLETGMYEVTLLLLAKSFETIHLGAFNLYEYNGIAIATQELKRMTLFAFSFAFPLFFIGFIMDVFFGYATRNTPAFSVFVVTFQLKFMLIFGFMILGMSIFIENFKEYFYQTVY
jgi:flagellar biosynthetic protein FliR